MIADWVYINGEMRPKSEATVSVFDHGFIYGDGVFEGIAVAAGGIFKLDAHIQRLIESATYLAISAPAAEVIRSGALATARRNALEDGYLRIVLTRGAGPVGIRNMDQLSAPTLVMIAQAEDRKKRQPIYENGIAAAVSSVRRIPPDCVDGKAKTCNYINNILAYLEIRPSGADTAVMLDTSGALAECHAANLFIVKDGVVRTPALGSILNGITRQTILEICREKSIPHAETRLTLHDLFCADEAFECGSLAEIKPIRSVSSRTIGSGRPGAMSRRLHEELRSLMESGRQSTPVHPA